MQVAAGAMTSAGCVDSMRCKSRAMVLPKTTSRQEQGQEQEQEQQGYRLTRGENAGVIVCTVFAIVMNVLTAVR